MALIITDFAGIFQTEIAFSPTGSGLITRLFVDFWKICNCQRFLGKEEIDILELQKYTSFLCINGY